MTKAGASLNTTMYSNQITLCDMSTRSNSIGSNENQTPKKEMRVFDFIKIKSQVNKGVCEMVGATELSILNEAVFGSGKIQINRSDVDRSFLAGRIFPPGLETCFNVKMSNKPRSSIALFEESEELLAWLGDVRLLGDVRRIVSIVLGKRDDDVVKNCVANNILSRFLRSTHIDLVKLYRCESANDHNLGTLFEMYYEICVEFRIDFWLWLLNRKPVNSSYVKISPCLSILVNRDVATTKDISIDDLIKNSRGRKIVYVRDNVNPHAQWDPFVGSHAVPFVTFLKNPKGILYMAEKKKGKVDKSRLDQKKSARLAFRNRKGGKSGIKNGSSQKPRRKKKNRSRKRHNGVNKYEGGSIMRRAKQSIRDSKSIRESKINSVVVMVDNLKDDMGISHSTALIVMRRLRKVVKRAKRSRRRYKVLSGLKRKNDSPKVVEVSQNLNLMVEIPNVNSLKEDKASQSHNLIPRVVVNDVTHPTNSVRSTEITLIKPKLLRHGPIEQESIANMPALQWSKIIRENISSGVRLAKPPVFIAENYDEPMISQNVDKWSITTFNEYWDNREQSTPHWSRLGLGHHARSDDDIIVDYLPPVSAKGFSLLYGSKAPDEVPASYKHLVGPEWVTRTEKKRRERQKESDNMTQCLSDDNTVCDWESGYVYKRSKEELIYLIVNHLAQIPDPHHGEAKIKQWCYDNFLKLKSRIWFTKDCNREYWTKRCTEEIIERRESSKWEYCRAVGYRNAINASHQLTGTEYHPRKLPTETNYAMWIAEDLWFIENEDPTIEMPDLEHHRIQCEFINRHLRRKTLLGTEFSSDINGDGHFDCSLLPYHCVKMILSTMTPMQQYIYERVLTGYSDFRLGSPQNEAAKRDCWSSNRSLIQAMNEAEKMRHPGYQSGLAYYPHVRVHCSYWNVKVGCNCRFCSFDIDHRWTPARTRPIHLNLDGEVLHYGIKSLMAVRKDVIKSPCVSVIIGYDVDNLLRLPVSKLYHLKDVAFKFTDGWDHVEIVDSLEDYNHEEYEDLVWNQNAMTMNIEDWMIIGCTSQPMSGSFDGLSQGKMADKVLGPFEILHTFIERKGNNYLKSIASEFRSTLNVLIKKQKDYIFKEDEAIPIHDPTVTNIEGIAMMGATFMRDALEENIITPDLMSKWYKTGKELNKVLKDQNELIETLTSDHQKLQRSYEDLYRSTHQGKYSEYTDGLKSLSNNPHEALVPRSIRQNSINQVKIFVRYWSNWLSNHEFALPTGRIIDVGEFDDLNDCQAFINDIGEVWTRNPGCFVSYNMFDDTAQPGELKVITYGICPIVAQFAAQTNVGGKRNNVFPDKIVAFKTGLPATTLDLSYRRFERSMFRNSQFKGTYFTNFPSMPRLSSELMDDNLNRLESLVSGKKVILTANPDSSPPIGYMAVSLTPNPPKGWLHFKYNHLYGGTTEMRMARMLLLYTSASEKWITNGREFAEYRENKPCLIPGRLSSRNRHHILPLLCSNFITDLQLNDWDDFVTRYIHYSTSYGPDELCLGYNVPLYVTYDKLPDSPNAIAILGEVDYPDVKIMFDGNETHLKPFNRHTVNAWLRDRGVKIHYVDDHITDDYESELMKHGRVHQDVTEIWNCISEGYTSIDLPVISGSVSTIQVNDKATQTHDVIDKSELLIAKEIESGIIKHDVSKSTLNTRQLYSYQEAKIAHVISKARRYGNIEERNPIAFKIIENRVLSSILDETDEMLTIPITVEDVKGDDLRAPIYIRRPGWWPRFCGNTCQFLIGNQFFRTNVDLFDHKGASIKIKSTWGSTNGLYLTMKGMAKIFDAMTVKHQERLLSILGMTRYKAVTQFQIARNSSLADIELDPGPNGETIKFDESDFSICQQMVYNEAKKWCDRGPEYFCSNYSGYDPLECELVFKTPHKFNFNGYCCKPMKNEGNNEIIESYANGMPIVSLLKGYRGRELSEHRKPWFTGLYFTYMPEVPPKECPRLRKALDDLNNLIKSIGSTKVCFTSQPDSKPPLGFTGISMTKAEGWLHFKFEPLYDGRAEMRFARLLIFYSEAKIKWVVNGRNLIVSTTPSPPCIPGRYTSVNHFSAAPVMLSSTITSVRRDDFDRFCSFYHHYSCTYGADEHFMKDWPLTVIRTRPMGPITYGTMGIDTIYKDVVIQEWSKIVYRGEFSREIAYHLSNPVSICELKPQNAWFDTPDFSIADTIDYISDPYADFEGKQETLLIVTMGSYGDKIPLEYVGRYIQSIGIKVKFWNADDLDGQSLREIIFGNVQRRIKGYLKLWGIQESGFKCYLLPHVPTFGKAITYDLTCKEIIHDVIFGTTFLGWCASKLVMWKKADITIGCVVGSNTPRSSNGLNPLRKHKNENNVNKIGWVSGSDGDMFIPTYIKANYPQITDTNHMEAFKNFGTIYAAGGQGTMQTIIACGAIAKSMAPVLDRRYKYDLTPDMFQANDFSLLRAKLSRFYSGIWATPVWMRPSQFEWKKWVIDLLICYKITLYLFPILVLIVALPNKVKSWLKQKGVKPFIELFDFLRSWPLVLLSPSLSLIMFIFFLWKIRILIGHWLSAYDHCNTRLVIEDIKQMPFCHVRVVDTERQIQAEMYFSGERNLAGLFTGDCGPMRPWKEGDTISIPAPFINIPLIGSLMRARSSRYRPWFNCQTNLLSLSDSMIIFLIVGMLQMFAFPLSLMMYSGWLLYCRIDPKIIDHPPNDFLRMGTADEWSDYLRTSIEIEDEIEANNHRVFEHLNKANTEQVEESEITTQVFRPVEEMIYTIDLDKMDTDETGKPKDDSQYLESVEELVDMTAHLALAAIGDGIPENHAIDMSLMALRKKILSTKIDDVKHIVMHELTPRPRPKFYKLLDELKELFLKYNPKIVRVFIQTITDMANNLKHRADQFIKVCSSFLDWVAEKVTDLYQKAVIVLTEIIDRIFDSKLSRRIKTVWALGGLGKIPRTSVYKRLEESIAVSQYTGTGIFEKDYGDFVHALSKHIDKVDTENKYVTAILAKDRAILEEYKRTDKRWSNIQICEHHPETGEPIMEFISKGSLKSTYGEEPNLKKFTTGRNHGVQKLLDLYDPADYDEVVFLTGNELKAHEMKQFHPDVEFFEIPDTRELRHPDVEIVARDKLEKSIINLPYVNSRTLYLCEDVGFSVANINGNPWPGSGVKYELSERKKANPKGDGMDLILERAAHNGNKGTEEFGYAGLLNGEINSVKYTTHGYLTNKKGNTGFGWDDYYQPEIHDVHIHAIDDRDAIIAINQMLGETGIKLGGPQVRKTILCRNPVMSDQEARALFGKYQRKRTGVSPIIDEYFTERVNSYLKDGVKLGVDGVYLCEQDSKKMFKSLERYSIHKDTDIKPGEIPPPLSSFMIDKARRAAKALADVYPEAIKESRLTPPEAIVKYLVKKYSPGVPFVSYRKTREEIFNAGFDHVIIKEAMNRLSSGKYPSQFYHAFPKSQVVDYLPLKDGTKQVRTVISQDLVSYFMDQVIYFYRNKLITWETTHIGSGMPLNQNMSRIFDTLRGNGVLFEGDAKEADSWFNQWTAEFHYHLAKEGLSDTLASVIKAKHTAMQNAYVFAITESPIIDHTHRGHNPVKPPYGNVVIKVQGGGTGESGTSNSLTYAVKGVMAAAWEEYHEGRRTIRDFFDDVAFSNTGDDNVGKMKDEFKGLDWAKFTDIARKYGLLMFIDEIGDITKVKYLGKQWRPVTEEDKRTLQEVSNRLNIEITVPDGVVYQNTKNILLRRTANRYYQQSPYRAQYLQSYIQKTVGHAQLAAFNPALYNRLIEEYYIDSQRYLLMKKTKGAPRLPETTEERELISSIISLKRDKQGWWYIQFDNRNVPRNMRERFKWLQQNKFPMYSKVVYDHMKPPHKTKEYHERLMAKLLKGSVPFDEKIRFLIDQMRVLTNSIPREWWKMQSGIDMIYPDPVWQTHNFFMESWLYLLHKPQSLAELDRYCQQGPLGTVSDAQTFWLMLDDDKFKKKVLDNPTWVYQNMVIFSVVIYGLFYILERYLSKISIIGPLYHFFMFAATDMNRVYSVLGILYWLVYGKSSDVISGLMPKDPYRNAKRISVFAVEMLIPVWFAYLFWLFPYYLQLASQIAEWISKIIQNERGDVSPMYKYDERPNEWDPYARQTLDLLKTDKRLFLKAPTGVGKSTWFIAALSQFEKLENPSNRLWLVTPRTILRDDWSIPFNIRWQVLKRGVHKDINAMIYLCTYGHLNQLIKAGRVPKEDIICFDEFHELQGEMVLAESSLKENRVVLLSATPRPVPGLTADTMQPKVTKRNKVHVFRFNMNVTGMYREAMVRDPIAAKRCMIIVPTYRMIDICIAGLKELKPGIPILEFSKRTAEPEKKRRETIMKRGQFIVVCSQMVDAGYDLKPYPPWLVIDSGLEIQVDRGVFGIRASSQTTAEQRWGRTGRNSDDRDGLVYAHEQSGTGASCVQYPSPSLFVEKVIANFFKVPQLTNIQNPTLEDFPVFKIDTDLEPEIQKGLKFCVLANASGVRHEELPKFYDKHAIREVFLPEEQNWMADILDKDRKLCKIKNLFKTNSNGYPNWTRLSTYLTGEYITWSIDHKLVKSGLITPVRGMWQTEVFSSFEMESGDYTNPHQVKQREIIKKKKLEILDLIPFRIKGALVAGSRTYFKDLNDGISANKRCVEIDHNCSVCKDHFNHDHKEDGLIEHSFLNVRTYNQH